MFKNFDEFQTAGKDRFEAAAAAAANFFKGVQQIATEATSYSRNSVTASVGLVEGLFGAKSLGEAIQIQSDAAKSAHEAFVAQTVKVGELYASLAKEAFRPVDLTLGKTPVKSRQPSNPA